MDLIPVIGLEIHAELKTQTKMFCDSRNDADEQKPNTNVCPVCMAHPGTLPVPNKQAIKSVLRVGKAIGAELADYSEFDRKNYFYPDIPKGYQISQYKFPLVKGGTILGFAVTRIHLEEDTARSSHDKGGYSLVDFNRAGVPLMELVTEPVIRSGDEAISFARELQLLLRELGVSDANMEKGEMRVEANISVGTAEKMGTKVEVKNLNSFRTVGRAIDYEIARQKELIAKGNAVIQETRGWDEGKQSTFSQRLKEESQDYRYFPEPDIAKLFISSIPEFSVDTLSKTLPELPWDRRSRYLSMNFGKKEAEMFVEDHAMRDFLENDVLPKLGGKPEAIKLALNYISSDLAGLLKKEGYNLDKTRNGFVEIISMLLEGKINSRSAKDLLETIAREGGSPAQIAEVKGLLQQNDSSLIGDIVSKVLISNEKVVAEYKAGKTTSLQFLVGQVMKESRGAANPALVSSLLIERLK